MTPAVMFNKRHKTDYKIKGVDRLELAKSSTDQQNLEGVWKKGKAAGRRSRINSIYSNLKNFLDRGELERIFGVPTGGATSCKCAKKRPDKV